MENRKPGGRERGVRWVSKKGLGRAGEWKKEARGRGERHELEMRKVRARRGRRQRGGREGWGKMRGGKREKQIIVVGMRK